MMRTVLCSALLVGACGKPLNRSPTVRIVDPMFTGQVMRGLPIILTMRVDNEDHEVFDLDYELYIDGLLHCAGAAESHNPSCNVELPVDRSTILIDAHVIDPAGALGDTSIRVNFPAPQAPIIGAFRTRPSPPVPGEPVELTAVVGSTSTALHHLRVTIRSDVDGVLMDRAVLAVPATTKASGWTMRRLPSS